MIYICKLLFDKIKLLRLSFPLTISEDNVQLLTNYYCFQRYSLINLDFLVFHFNPLSISQPGARRTLPLSKNGDKSLIRNICFPI